MEIRPTLTLEFIPFNCNKVNVIFGETVIVTMRWGREVTYVQGMFIISQMGSIRFVQNNSKNSLWRLKNCKSITHFAYVQDPNEFLNFDHHVVIPAE